MEPNILFCYGILKRGFSLDLTRSNCKFIGEARIPGTQLYAIGGGVGLRFCNAMEVSAKGEVFAIPDKLWPWLDDIEQNGFCYTRKVENVYLDTHEEVIESWDVKEAWVYAHTFPNMKYTTPIESNEYGV
jgi:gamma-glutamylcyclotransferase (GGCT)/AIG2-like uncharacterized protein YtfP